MKVGTDGVLLGAWAPVDQAHTALDVGTGTGLVALQLAQRNPHLRVTAVEIDAPAAAQAAENVAGSPWPDRIEVVCADFNDFQPDGRFDLIVSNPPYFVDALPCPDRQRNTARHAGGLNYDLLFRRSARLLSEGGVVSIVIPSEVERAAEDAAWMQGLGPVSPASHARLHQGRQARPPRAGHVRPTAGPCGRGRALHSPGGRRLLRRLPPPDGRVLPEVLKTFGFLRK